MKPSFSESPNLNKGSYSSEMNKISYRKKFPSTPSSLDDEQFSFKEYLLIPNNEEKPNKLMGAEEAFYFIFCCEEELILHLHPGIRKKLQPYRGALYYNKAGTRFSITSTRDKIVKIYVIKMSQNSDKADSSHRFFVNFRKNFQQIMPQGLTLFIGKPVYDIVTKLEKLSRLSKQMNLADKLMIQGLILEVFGLQIEQVLGRNKEVETGTLTLCDLDQIRGLSTRIRENPAVGYNILSFSKDTGLSPKKLQEGFKRIYNRTIIDYVREVRLEVAIELMKTTDLNISEIVYSIGFTSRSYFSKIFKRKYNCSPSYYQEIQRRCSEVA